MRSLQELKERSDKEAVRMWLVDRGMCAVELRLMEEIVGFCGVTLDIILDADDFSYHKNRYSRSHD